MKPRIASIALIVTVSAVSFGVAGSNDVVRAAGLTRAADPVVLTGSQLPTLVAGSKTTIVGFRWNGAAWQQLPIQIDERAIKNFSTIYNNAALSFYGSEPGLVDELVYTATSSWTGKDPDVKFDNDDELVFMARDAGVQSPGGSQPAGTAVGTGVEVHVTDPVTVGNEGYVYLFRKSAGSPLKQAAGAKYQKYVFKLLSGGYKPTYNLTGTPNPENSLVTGATYKRHFSDRWLTDQLTITAPGATAVDILDRNKVLFAPSVCSRSEDTFNASGPYGSAEGAYVINKNGPVRSIRSFVGANSGPNTQRTHFFYDRREDVRTDLRVHAIPSVMDFVDYSPAASGMTYRNVANPAGVPVDGNPDSLTAGSPTWEQIAGAQGTVTMVRQLTASFTPTVTNYYLDDSTPATPQCTGDAFAYASSGSYITSSIPCTDPGTGCAGSMAATTTLFYEAPGGDATTAAQHDAEVAQPLVATTGSWVP